MLHVSSVQKGRTNLRTSGAVGLHITKNGPRRQYELLLPVHEDDILRLKDCVNAQHLPRVQVQWDHEDQDRVPESRSLFQYGVDRVRQYVLDW